MKLNLNSLVKILLGGLLIVPFFEPPYGYFQFLRIVSFLVLGHSLIDFYRFLLEVTPFAKSRFFVFCYCYFKKARNRISRQIIGDITDHCSANRKKIVWSMGSRYIYDNAIFDRKVRSIPTHESTANIRQALSRYIFLSS